jgi:hypothetical protein
MYQTAYKKHDKYKDKKLTAHGKTIVTVNTEPTRTKQSLAEDLDVNKIIKKYADTGIRLDAANFEGIYGDFDGMDYREALEKLDQAENLFMQVPSRIRAEFDNNPGAFIEFATDPNNIQQMRQWGLAKPAEPDPEPPEPIPVTVINQPE